MLSSTLAYADKTSGYGGEVDKSRASMQAAKDLVTKNPTPENKQQLQDVMARERATMSAISEKSADDPGTQVQIARAYTDVGEPQDAIAYANKAISLDPANTDAYVVRGNANFQLNRFEAAGQDAQSALAIDPNNKPAIAIKELAAGKVGALKLPAKPQGKGTGPEQPEGKPLAPGMADRAAATQKRRASDALVDQSLTELNLDPKRAEGLADQAILADTENPKAYVQRAQARLRMNDLDGAVADLTAAIEKGLKQALIYDLRSAAYAMKKDWRKANDDADAALLKDVNDARAWHNKAVALEGLGVDASAVKMAAEKAAELDPQFQAELQRTLQRLASGGAAAGAGDGGSRGSASGEGGLLSQFAGLPTKSRLALGVGLLSAAVGGFLLLFAKRGTTATPAPVVVKASGDLQPGTILAGNFEVKQLLGNGGMGMV